MSVHAHIPARATLPLRVEGRARLGAVPSQVWWSSWRWAVPLGVIAGGAT